MSPDALWALAALSTLLLALLVGHLSARVRELEEAVDDLQDPLRARRRRLGQNSDRRGRP